MSRERLSELNVLTVFAGMDEAREAVHALERAGVEGGDVSLLGPGADEVRDGFLNGMGEAADLAFSSVKSGEVVVGVHTDSEAELDTASQVLEEHGPKAIAWFDHRGRKLQYSHARRR